VRLEQVTQTVAWRAQRSNMASPPTTLALKQWLFVYEYTWLQVCA